MPLSLCICVYIILSHPSTISSDVHPHPLTLIKTNPHILPVLFFKQSSHYHPSQGLLSHSSHPLYHHSPNHHHPQHIFPQQPHHPNVHHLPYTVTHPPSPLHQRREKGSQSYFCCTVPHPYHSNDYFYCLSTNCSKYKGGRVAVGRGMQTVDSYKLCPSKRQCNRVLKQINTERKKQKEMEARQMWEAQKYIQLERERREKEQRDKEEREQRDKEQREKEEREHPQQLDELQQHQQKLPHSNERKEDRLEDNSEGEDEDDDDESLPGFDNDDVGMKEMTQRQPAVGVTNTVGNEVKPKQTQHPHPQQQSISGDGKEEEEEEEDSSDEKMSLISPESIVTDLGRLHPAVIARRKKGGR